MHQNLTAILLTSVLMLHFVTRNKGKVLGLWRVVKVLGNWMGFYGGMKAKQLKVFKLPVFPLEL